eukprot:m.34287 g.34287  ORF g.34287 m.34287 type:complete len:102 (+) comp31965_c0_seq9:588-893(+)
MPFYVCWHWVHVRFADMRQLVVGSVPSSMGRCTVSVTYAKELTFSPTVSMVSVPKPENANNSVDGKIKTSSSNTASRESNSDVILPFCATPRKLPTQSSVR